MRCLVASVLVLVTANGCSGQDSAAPPSPPTDAPYVWVSSPEVPSSGAATLAAVVINPTAEEVTFGVSGTFERWNGSTWKAAGGWTVSLQFWGGAGSVGGPENPVVPSIGLVAAPHGIGSAEYFSVPRLDSGWYRVSHLPRDRAPIPGVFHVTSDAPKPPPLSSPIGGKVLLAGPSLLDRSGGEVRLAGSSTEGGTSEDIIQFNLGFDPTVSLERWTGRSWKHVTTVAVHDAPEPKHLFGEVAVTLPRLEPAAYRLTRHHRQIGDLSQVVWVR